MIDSFVLSLWERSGGQVRAVTQSSWMPLMKPDLRSKTGSVCICACACVCKCIQKCVCVRVCICILTTTNELVLLCCFGDVCLFLLQYMCGNRGFGRTVSENHCSYMHDMINVYRLLARRRVWTGLTLDAFVWLPILVSDYHIKVVRSFFILFFYCCCKSEGVYAVYTSNSCVDGCMLLCCAINNVALYLC